MHRISLLILLCFVMLQFSNAAEPQVLFEDKFTELSKDWFWGLGTWTAKDGVLRGFESGPRRHGPVKMHQLKLADAVLECEFKLEGKATFAGIIFNGSQERGHLVHLVMSKDTLRIIAHPQKGESIDLIKEPCVLKTGEWHHVRMEFKGANLKAMVNAQTLNVSHPCLTEARETFGLGGDSGGPEGEKAGTLEFRRLKITALP